MNVTWRYVTVWLSAWLLLLCTALWSRGLFPVDETRYVGVAWEMWDSGRFLVPTLNGEPYSHKPPLMFWLIHLGWWMFGVNDWWPRVLPGLFALGTLYLTHQLARILWPHRPRVALLAPTILAGTTLWMLFVSAAMFDMMLTFWVLLAIRVLLGASREEPGTGEEVFVLALGMGILTKGPVMLIHVLPMALLLPVAVPVLREHRRRWYAMILGGTLVSIVFVMIWAAPAALYAGDAYAQAIFWEQSAGRAVDSFAHQRAWWWYLAIAPVVLFPWLIWPRVWQGLARAWSDTADWALRACAIWVVPTFLIFCMISGKQAHYVLPLMPGFALLAARALVDAEALRGAGGRWAVGLGFFVLALLALWLAESGVGEDWPQWVGRVLPVIGAIFLVAGVALTLLLRAAGIERQVVGLTAVMVVTFSVVSAVIYDYGGRYYDIRSVSEFISHEQQRGFEVANVGDYYDQFHFYGRLHWSIDVLSEREALAWARGHSDGRVVVYYDHRPDAKPAPLYETPYRGRWLAVWSSRELVEHPELVHTG